ncbi:hypothetical protein AN958_02124 [Leucoagaricus sp. SymC.cos]|nr:hypothetical protein AN958_02124 [Leucoagaricus sp. SymC.cos]
MATSDEVDPELPNYAEIAGDTAVITSANDNPTSLISTSPWRSEFRTGLQDETGYAWLVLRVKSRSPNAKNNLFFVEGDTISGVVELDAGKISSVKTVFIEVGSYLDPGAFELLIFCKIQAGTTAVGQEEERFLSMKESLWPSAEGDKSSTKLRGENEWPFEFVLPKEVEVVSSHGKRGLYQLPPSFSERASPAYLDYKIVVTVRRGAFHVSQKLSTTFVYQPITYPESPPTPLMRLAYSERSPIPSPKQDSEGWKALPRLGFEGVLFGVKNVEVRVQLSLGKPLQYALGSAIPLYLEIESEDTQALDVLSIPTAAHVYLTRAMTTGSEATAQNPERRSNNFFTVALSRGYFWSVDEPGNSQNRRTLSGEIDLEVKFKPSFVFPRLSIGYTVDFVGFEATGWNGKSRGLKGAPLLSEPVKVTSRQLAGVTMRSNAPPGYQKPTVDFNKSLGYLENGNQRFLHHGGFM